MICYVQVVQFIRLGDCVIDVVCGFGYGFYQLVYNSDVVLFMGFDVSDYVVEYVNLNFVLVLLMLMMFVVGDVQNLLGMVDVLVDFVVFVEMLEYFFEFDCLLVELYCVLLLYG